MSGGLLQAPFVRRCVHLIHTRRDVAYLVYLVASYAVSIGVPGGVADAVARRAVAPLGVLSEPS